MKHSDTGSARCNYEGAQGIASPVGESTPAGRDAGSTPAASTQSEAQEHPDMPMPANKAIHVSRAGRSVSRAIVPGRPSGEAGRGVPVPLSHLTGTGLGRLL